MKDGQIALPDYHKMKERVEKDLTGLELRLKDLKQDKSPFKVYVNQTLPMLVNLVEYYRKSDGLTKKKILSCIFSKKLTFENGRVTTFEFTTAVEVLLSVYRVFEGSETKKEVKFDLFFILLPR